MMNYFRLSLSVLLVLLASMARAEIVVVVNKDSKISELTQKEVIDIYMGRRQSFPDGSPAFPLDQAGQSEIRENFYKALVNKSPAQINAYWARLLFTGRASPPRIMNDSMVLLEAIEQNPAAIGYVDSSMLNDRVRAVAYVE